MFERPYNYYSPPFNDNANYYSAHFQTPFEMYSKPKLPVNWNPNDQSGGMYKPSSASNNLMQYFQNDNGEMDLDKVLTTVGKLANTFQQISPVVKDMGAMIKKL